MPYSSLSSSNRLLKVTRNLDATTLLGLNSIAFQSPGPQQKTTTHPETKTMIVGKVTINLDVTNQPARLDLEDE